MQRVCLRIGLMVVYLQSVGLIIVVPAGYLTRFYDACGNLGKLGAGRENTPAFLQRGVSGLCDNGLASGNR